MNHGAPIQRLLQRVFSGPGFPVAVLSLLVFYKLLLVIMLWWPVSSSVMGQFAEEFKTWCFGYDPATGTMNTSLVWMMLTEPLVLGGLVAVLWWGPLRAAAKAPARLWPYPVGAFLVMAAGAVVLTSVGERTTEQGELPFPAVRIRTAFEPPKLALVDQTGQPTSLEAYRGQVVVVTGVYASCGFTCPMIMGQVKRAVANLSEGQREQVTVLAITLDPERDTPERLAAMAEAQNVRAPRFRLLTGEPGYVHSVLDRLGIERRRDPQTGVIDHSNLFLVVDRNGKIAYRFSLGERQTQWLTRSLEYLLAEPQVG